MNIEIANRLVNLRKKNGYSQEELADKIGISRQAVSKWERAESSPDTDNLIALSRLYKMSLDDLLRTGGKEGQQETGGQEPQPEDPDKSGHPKRGMFLFPYPAVTVFLFFLIGFLTKQWQYAWLIYLTVPVYYGIAMIVDQKKHKK